ncbi:hypothetical protein BCR34DRAFT_492590 [Clohesyomyces aquaticus]|uniref:Terpenoid cyclases/protein prenyltransferase alpha-alpha toroid n=1 Tax=Clohesyomyces aquaticus TaxID=1231657 RepID=A0A1Y1YYX4_9PLEO|nr:hypothetical protein BCR34DRAFT_492590 [Clohesyomyces aquaticus]
MYDARYGIGTMTCSVYDTAWVANVTKTVNGNPQYLFPSSFMAILRAQSPDGHWEGHFNAETANLGCSPPSLTDSILSTMASLYTLALHAKHPYQIRANSVVNPPLEQRIRQAVTKLTRILGNWRIESCNAVGFEVLAPGLLDLLSAEGFEFDFPSKTQLLKLRDAKLARLSPEMMYKLGPSALLHSLEAFHGWGPEKLDMEKIKHHMVGGSMMASPAATASYLMKTKEWDDAAEAYLRLAIQCGEGQGSGCVPSAYPSTNFEILWMTSTFAEFSMCNNSYTSQALELVSGILERPGSSSTSLIGFAPGIEPDLDDSAKASIVMSLSGTLGFSEAIINNFNSSRCLKTYSGERDPSVSANCNALMSILVDQAEYEGKVAIIEKIVTFICASWVEAKGTINDKWNLSPHYTVMLISRSMVELLLKWSTGGLPLLDGHIISFQAAPLLLQCLTFTLSTQHYDGAWGEIGPFEETAYAVLALVSLSSLPLPPSLSRKVVLAIERGRNFLLKRGSAHCEFLWIEKITYGSRNLMDTYVITALNASLELLSEHGKKAASSGEVELDEMLTVHGEIEKMTGGVTGDHL